LTTVASRLTKAFSNEADHAGYVDAWLDRAAQTPAPAQLITLFEQALGALWRRTEGTLGEVTLTAIVDRVLYTASEQYPFLSTLTVESAGISFDGLRSQGAHDTNLRDALCLVLVEFLTVLGHLTDEILTPALHAELSRVPPSGPGAAEGNDDGAPGAGS
jgi:hypothetical protein